MCFNVKKSFEMETLGILLNQFNSAGSSLYSLLRFNSNRN